MLAIVISIVAGLAATVQASFNTESGRITKSPYFTAAFNFVVSFVILVIIALITEHNLYIPLAEIAKHPIWIWSGGACGPVVIIMSILCLPKLGSAKNMMLACTGQILAGLVIDQFGLFGSQQISMSLARTLGAVLVIGGIVAASFEKENKQSGGKAAVVSIFTLLALINGTAAAIQVAANGTLNTVVGSASKTTIVSMCVAFITINIVMLFMALIKSPDALFYGDEKFHFVKPNILMLFGGTCSVVVVGGNAIAAVVLGTGLVNVLNLAGMMAMSLVIDAAGFLGIPKKPVTAIKVIGMILIIIGAALISLV